MDNSLFPVPLFTYRNFPRREGLTVEQSLASLGIGVTADVGVQMPETLIDDCGCCAICNDRCRRGNEQQGALGVTAQNRTAWCGPAC
jgi:hypothetical protein